MAGDVQYCNNCRRNIAAPNYVIHSVHCERKIQLCDSCNEPVPRSEMQRHMEEYHTLDACELCEEEMERFQMADHRDSCCKRSVPCKFCNLESPFDKAEEHQFFCGTRTEMCATCKTYVKLVDQEAHKATCQREQRARQLSTCDYCHVEMPTSLFNTHAASCESKTEKSPQFFEPVTLKDKNRHECQVVFIPCEFCDTSIPSDHFVEHFSVCGLRYKNCLKCNASFMLKDKDEHTCQSPSKSVGRCSVCHVAVPWVDLREHEAGCRLAAFSSSSSSEEEDKKPKFSAIRTYQERQSNYRGKTDSRTQKGTQETPTILKMKQCPYCKERYPDLIVEEHSKHCDHRSFKCEFCGKSVLMKDKQRHEKRDCQMRHSTNYNYADNENNLAGATGYTKEFEKNVKQCPYCKKKFPEIMFADHQAVCAERPYQCPLCLKMMPWRDSDRHESKECLFLDRVKKLGSGDTKSKVVPVYQRSFEKDYLEKNSQVCPYCKNRIPEAKIAHHVQCCTDGKKPCHFCGAEIRMDEENRHLQQCIAKNDKDSGFQTAGGKRGKKKNKKGRQNEPEPEPKGFFSTAKNFFIRKPSSPEKEFVRETYFSAQVVHLPCEFCDELFPEYLLIEHQSGCRPDLVSLPTAADASNYRASPDEGRFLVTSRDQRYLGSTGALPKRNRFHEDSAEVKPGEFLAHQSPSNVGRDYYNYPSGVPDYIMKPDVGNQSKTAFNTRTEMPDNKAASEKMDKKLHTKTSATRLFNFSSSSSNNNNSSTRSKSPPSIFSNTNDQCSPTKQKHSETRKTELKAVGAERAERKGIIRISRDTSLNFEEETLDEYDNFQMPKDSRNSDNMSRIKKNHYSSKLISSERELNIPFADEPPFVVQHESIESNCDARLARLLNDPETSDVTEDDAKNDETFGSDFDPREPLLLSNEEERFSDSMEQFYDAEDDLKTSNLEKRNSPGNDDLDAYVKLLAKDEDEMIAFNNNNKMSRSPSKDKGLNCECENRICYCGIVNRTSVSGNNNYLGTEREGHQGNSNNVESSKLPSCRNASRATNFNSKELYQPNIENQINAEIQKRSPKFTEWRPKNVYSSDSD